MADNSSSLKLSLLDIEGSVNSKVEPTKELSMVMSSTMEIGRLQYTTTYSTRESDDKAWEAVTTAKPIIFEFSLKHISFKKQMYSPNEIEAKILVVPAMLNNLSVKAFIPIPNLYKLFAKKKVNLYCDEKSACANYVIYEIIPQILADKMYLTLKIYSPDKELSLEQASRSFISKKLGAEIMKESTVSVDYSQMKILKKNDKEHIFPYLVQYNESFYDFVARTTNRWGEFFYFEGKNLHIGYVNKELQPAAKEITMKHGILFNLKPNNDKYAKKVTSYYQATFRDLSSSSTNQYNSSSYYCEAPYDSNILKSVVKKDSYDKVKGEICDAADPDNGADTYWMKKVGAFLGNDKSLKNFLFDTAVDDLISLAQAKARVSRRNGRINDMYFNDSRQKGNEADHYNSDKDKFNEFSESSPIVDDAKYAQILKSESLAAQNVIEIEFDTRYPDLSLGEVIEFNGALYIVNEVVGYQPESFTKKNGQYYEKGYVDNVVNYRIIALAKGADKFYPTMIPAGHVRQSGSQVAVVVNDDDPNNTNRVRVKFPWQFDPDIIKRNNEIEAENKKIEEENKKKSDSEKVPLKDLIKSYEDLDLTKVDKNNSTPWLFYASPSGPKSAGIHARHYNGEKVLVDFANGNVECPFVVGAVSADVPTALKTGSAVIAAPNLEQIKVHEGSGNGAGAFIGNLNPGLKMINGFVPFTFGKDWEKSNLLEGGIDLGDRYGIWSIKGSTDGRNVSISSAWGDVKINAFTGITISAPNGDVKITGKNVSIEAGNNLTLTSGKNIKNKFISTYGDGVVFNMVSFGADITKMVEKKLVSLAANIVDLSIVRSVLEIVVRPVEGTLTVKSNRFLKLEAGGSSAGFPDAIYKDPRKQARAQLKGLWNGQGTLDMGPAMKDLINSIGPVVDAMERHYKVAFSKCIKNKNNFDNAIANLRKYTEDADVNTSAVCNTYTELKNKFWDAGTKEITIADLGFKEVVQDSQVNSVHEQCMNRIYNGNGIVGGHKYLYVIAKKSSETLKQEILDSRRDKKKAVLTAANELLKSIKELTNLPLLTGSATKNVGYFFNYFTHYVPASYISDMQEAFSKDKLKDSKFFKYLTNDQDSLSNRTDLVAIGDLDFSPWDKVILKRRVAKNLVEGWGFTQQAIRRKLNGNAVVDMALGEIANVPEAPKSEADFANNAKWQLYVESLTINDVKIIKKETGTLIGAVKDALDKMCFFSVVPENRAWGNAKDGQILFGTGSTYALTSSGNISPISANYNSGKISTSDLWDKDKAKVESLTSLIRDTLQAIDAPAAPYVNNGNVIMEVDEGEEDDNE